jgi:hypothetical protein
VQLAFKYNHPYGTDFSYKLFEGSIRISIIRIAAGGLTLHGLYIAPLPAIAVSPISGGCRL